MAKSGPCQLNITASPCLGIYDWTYYMHKGPPPSFSFVSQTDEAPPAKCKNLCASFISEVRANCFVPRWIILEVAVQAGQLVGASFSCSFQWERRPRTEAARTLTDGPAFCPLPVPDVSRCYESTEGSAADTDGREMAALPVMNDHLTGHPL